MYKLTCIFIAIFIPFFSSSQEIYRTLLIVSCGGGGTGYTSTSLQKGGLDIKHEKMGVDGMISWPHVAGPYNWQGKEVPEVNFCHIFHQVRNPLSVIQTWLKKPTIFSPDWRFIRSQIPQISIDDPKIVQCAKYWYYWNLKAEEIAEWRFKVEELNEVAGEFERILGVSLNKEAMAVVPKDTHSWPWSPSFKISWTYLMENLPPDLVNDLQKMAERYGYRVTDDFVN